MKWTLVFLTLGGLVLLPGAAIAITPVPAVWIISPEDGFAYATGALVVEVGYEAKDGGRGNVKFIDLFVGGELLETKENPPNVKSGVAIFEVDMSGLEDQSIELVAYAYQGNRRAQLRGESETVSVMLDRTSPEVSIVVPDDQFLALNQFRVGCVLRFYDGLSGVDPEGVRLILDSTEVSGSLEHNGAGEASFSPVTDLAEGNHSYRASVVDRAGNSSEPVTVSFDVVAALTAERIGHEGGLVLVDDEQNDAHGAYVEVLEGTFDQPVVVSIGIEENPAGIVHERLGSPLVIKMDNPQPKFGVEVGVPYIDENLDGVFDDSEVGISEVFLAFRSQGGEYPPEHAPIYAVNEDRGVFVTEVFSGGVLETLAPPLLIPYSEGDGIGANNLDSQKAGKADSVFYWALEGDHFRFDNPPQMTFWSEETLIQDLEEAVRAWDEASPCIRFVGPVTESFANSRPESSVVFRTGSVKSGVGKSSIRWIVLQEGVPPKVTFDDDSDSELQRQASIEYLDFKHTAIHEIGHALGLSHTRPDWRELRRECDSPCLWPGFDLCTKHCVDCASLLREKGFSRPEIVQRLDSCFRLPMMAALGSPVPGISPHYSLDEEDISRFLSQFPCEAASGIFRIIDPSGDGQGHELSGAPSIAIDRKGNIYVSGFITDNAFKITPDGVVTQIIDASGDGDGNFLDGAHGIAVDDSDNVFVTGVLSDNVFRITPDGSISQIIDRFGDLAGHPLVYPVNIDVDESGNVYVTGTHSNNVFKISPSGEITLVIESAGDSQGNSLRNPFDVAVDGSGDIFVAGTGTDNVFRITPLGEITEIMDISGDQEGNLLDGPMQLVVDDHENVYVAARVSNNAFMISSSGEFRKLIDSSGDRSGNQLLDAFGVAVDTLGNVYVTGYLSHNVFKITPAGKINQIIDYFADGGDWPLVGPTGVVVDGAGTTYVVAMGSSVAFKITP